MGARLATAEAECHQSIKIGYSQTVLGMSLLYFRGQVCFTTIDANNKLVPKDLVHKFVCGTYFR